MCRRSMLFQTIVSIIGFSISICSDVVVETRYDFRTMTRFPVELYSPDLGRTIPGYACLDLSDAMIGFSSSSSDEFEDRNGVHVSEIRFANSTSLRYNYRVPMDWDNGAFPTAHINADFASDFLHQVGSYLMTPVSHSEGLIVINPVQPEIYAYNGELFYARSTHQEMLQIMTAIKVVPGDRRDEPPSPIPLTNFHRCSISTGQHDDEEDDLESIWLPPTVWDTFMNELTRLGVVSESARLRNRNSFDRTIQVEASLAESTILDRLPSIQFFVELVNGSQAAIHQVYPREYFALHRSSRGAPTTGLLLVFTSPIPYCELGKRFLKNVVMHVDGRNRLIGFGDPLIEF